jgi:hypothetical protein
VEGVGLVEGWWRVGGGLLNRLVYYNKLFLNMVYRYS